MKLTLKRAGTFEANWKTTKAVCGHPKLGLQRYNYSCEIVSDSAHLDENGFIFDQLEVDNLFQETYDPPSMAESCEEMALRFVEIIGIRVTKHGGTGTVKGVKVSIGPVPPAGVVGEASITAEWEAL